MIDTAVQQAKGKPQVPGALRGRVAQAARRALIGTRLRERRKALGLTQAALAARLGISASYLNLIEADRRNVGGALLQRLAAELQLPLDELAGAAEHRLAGELADIAQDPLVAPLRLDALTAAGFIARQRGWAQALVRVHRAYLERSDSAAALADRLNHDPVLAATVHELLTQLSAVRSAAEILDSEAEALEAAQRQRFVRIIAEDSRRLTEVARMLAASFGPQGEAARSRLPAEEVDDFIAGHDNHFPALEEVAQGLRAAFEAGPPSAADPGLPESTRRFARARALAEASAGPAVDAVLQDTAIALSPEAVRRLRRSLRAYVAGAVCLPYEPFLAAARACRYDIDLLAQRWQASFEQVCHRLVTLRRPGAEGLRFGFVRSDAAGHINKRLALPRLPLPVHGNACPLWALFGAFQAPGTLVRQLAEFPAGDRYLLIARAVDKDRPAWGMPVQRKAVMLIADALHADRLVYGDGLDAGGATPAVPVGQSCRVCMRSDCAWRQEDAVTGPLAVAPGP